MQYNVADYLDWYETYGLSLLYRGRDRHPFLERTYTLLLQPDAPEPYRAYEDAIWFDNEEYERQRIEKDAIDEMWKLGDEENEPTIGDWLLDRQLYPVNYLSPTNLDNMIRIFEEAPDDYIDWYLEIFTGAEDYDNPTLAEAIVVSPIVREIS